MDPKQRFHGHFQTSIAELEDQISQVESVSAVAGERQEAVDHILAGIAKLQNEVADAADFTPSYDRKKYSETVKYLQDKLSAAVARVAPKSRFQFTRSVNRSHVDMGAPENDPRLNPGSLSRNRMAARPRASGEGVENRDNVANMPQPSDNGKDYNKELSQPGTSAIRKPSFSSARHITISDQSGLHIILPESASQATAAGTLTNLCNCVIDMSVPTTHGRPFAGLSLRNIKNSLVIAGRVSGPVHITDVSDSIILVVAGQVRIHDCKNVDVYLHCTSHPIIEDCRGMRFAPLPDCQVRAHNLTQFLSLDHLGSPRLISMQAAMAESSTENQWDQVDDFKWLKAGHSPNWTTLSATQMLGRDIWTKDVPGVPGASVDETLRKVGLPRR